MREVNNILIAKVAVDKAAYGCDILYSYLVPEDFESLIRVGQRVIVPFGKGSVKRMGLVCELSREKNNNLKSIYAMLDRAPLICDEMTALIKWMKNHCFCSYFEAAKLFFPPGLGSSINSIKYSLSPGVLSSLNNLNSDEQNFINKIKAIGKKSATLGEIIGLQIKNYNKILLSLISKGIITEEFTLPKTVGERAVKILSLSEKNAVDKFPLTLKQKKVCEFLNEAGKATAKEICYHTGVGKFVIEKLVKNNILSSSECVEYQSPQKFETDAESKVKSSKLSEEQQKVFEEILKEYQKGEYNVSLMHGVTGSGKTHVLLKLVDYVLSHGKSAIFMVPEIALTEQFIGIFKARYQNKTTVIHSGLSAWERFDAWKRIKSGEIQVIVGTRSAVFAPLNNIGLIIIDEEHEFTYKSEASPRFSAKDVANYRCKYHDAMMVLSSATPSVESYFKAEIGKYNLYSLKKRYGVAKLPEVRVIDMNKTSIGLNTEQFSPELINALKDNIKNKKQSIIFLNRRGYSTFAKCRSCGEVLTCPNCSVSLNYHKANNRLMCHYCGYSCEIVSKCTHCGQEKVCYLGAGTQKAEDALSKIIPEAKILRMDSDTKNAKEFYNTAFKDFADGKYDILLGTQMISKGFNFPNVTLVGVLSADQYLYSGDFRSYEKTFNLITQVVGRSGRDKFPGTAIIQTFTPENEVLNLAASQDYKTFFDNEIKIRKAMLYPPFADICVAWFAGESENKVTNASFEFFEDIKKEAAENHSSMPLRIFPPVSAAVKKVSGKYRYKLIIKCKNNSDFKAMISGQLIKFSRKPCAQGLHVYVDINPDAIL